MTVKGATESAKLVVSAAGNQATAAVVFAGVTLWAKAEVKSHQDKIKSDAQSLDQRIHENAVQCLAHAAKHGDTSLMVRLIRDTLDKTGYRVQGLVQWMRLYSPMELSGNVINLSGILTSEAACQAAREQHPDVDPTLFKVGERRPFLVAEGNAKPFWTDERMREVVKPVYQAAVVSPINAAVKRLKEAVDNTANGKPIDPAKPFYDGIHTDKVVDIMEKVKALMADLPHDETKEVRDTQQRIARDLGYLPAEAKAETLKAVA